MKNLASLALLCCLIFSASIAEATEVRRFALLIGMNDGGPERPRLRYAESDARSVGNVLRHMGGVARQDEVFVLSASPTDIDLAFQRVANKLESAREPGVRTELIAYYSGHSDEFGLLLAGERYSYGKFRDNLEGLPADVRILVLDSCASGAIIRHKGGARRASFLMDASSDVRGQAIVTSSSIDEAAQESDDVGGSYFTHFLVSGLRGAADRNRDSRVTLAEAYEFAFSNTLEATDQSAAGPQHAGYDFQLMGHGDITLTMFTPTTSTLELSNDIVGRVFVWTRTQRLAVEVQKSYGQAVEIGLPPGDYSVTIARAGNGWRADVELPEIGRRTLSLSDFDHVELTPTRSRGNGGSESVTVTNRERARSGKALPWYRHVLLPGAVVAGGTSIIALIHAAEAERQANELLNLALYDDQVVMFPWVADEYVFLADEYESRARRAQTTAAIAGSVGIGLVLTEIGFRLFSRRNLVVGIDPTTGGAYARARF